MAYEQKNMQDLGRAAAKDYKERQLVVFNLGNEEFGVNINEVNSILKMSPITRIPNAQYYIEGVINLRGQIMVVIDLAKKLGLPPKERDKNTRIIVIETNETMVGMIVDHSREVIRISEDNIQPPPALITQKVKAEYLEGVAIIDKQTEKQKEKGGTLKDETSTQQQTNEKEVGGEELTVQKDSRLLILLDLAKVLNSDDVETAQMAQKQEVQTEQQPTQGQPQENQNQPQGSSQEQSPENEAKEEASSAKSEQGESKTTGEEGGGETQESQQQESESSEEEKKDQSQQQEEEQKQQENESSGEGEGDENKQEEDEEKSENSLADFQK